MLHALACTSTANHLTPPVYSAQSNRLHKMHCCRNLKTITTVCFFSRIFTWMTWKSLGAKTRSKYQQQQKWPKTLSGGENAFLRSFSQVWGGSLYWKVVWDCRFTIFHSPQNDPRNAFFSTQFVVVDILAIFTANWFRLILVMLINAVLLYCIVNIYLYFDIFYMTTISQYFLSQSLSNKCFNLELMLFDTDWWWLMLIDADSCWLRLIDADCLLSNTGESGLEGLHKRALHML